MDDKCLGIKNEKNKTFKLRFGLKCILILLFLKSFSKKI